MPANVRLLGHVAHAPAQRLQLLGALAVLNIARDSMAAVGFSPATRVFEAAGAGACLITDAWEGIELFLKPDEEILVARDVPGCCTSHRRSRPRASRRDRPPRPVPYPSRAYLRSSSRGGG